ncbi:MAG: hypothetical protein CMH56_14650 [Myxococcales bacterium]|nr:hypothetical protein [Myxococcales bacterium]
MSHIPGSELSYPLPFDGGDKLIHLVVFIFVGLSARWALSHGFLPPAGLGVAFGAVDEIHQYFVPGRYCDGWDVLADAIGVLVGCALGHYLFFGTEVSHEPT